MSFIFFALFSIKYCERNDICRKKESSQAEPSLIFSQKGEMRLNDIKAHSSASPPDRGGSKQYDFLEGCFE